jgi:bifunctional NMN adenylyltransferase/nudix hydrolase
MIRSTLTDVENERISFIRANDYFYNDNMWITSVQEKMNEATHGSKNISLFGTQKDSSSFYLDLFPQWKRELVKYEAGIDATSIRDLYFTLNLRDITRFVHPNVYEKLRNDMMINAVTPRDSFMDLKNEYEYIENYKAQWKGAPFPPTFTTADAVVVQSGHVLVVRRRSYPGKGLIALPGGFLETQGKNGKPIDRSLEQCALRELREETRIKMTKQELKAAIVDDKVFDHPERSLRGRTITHAFCMSLGHGSLAKVQGEDDADKAWWMSLREVMTSEEKFFEDHFHIINHFVNKF